MSTVKPRIQVTLDDDTNAMLACFAKQHDSSMSSVAADLIRQALELYEDKALSKLGDKRWEKATRWYSHEEAWK